MVKTTRTRLERLQGLKIRILQRRLKLANVAMKSAGRTGYQEPIDNYLEYSYVIGERYARISIVIDDILDSE